jgi:hypothetical protein
MQAALPLDFKVSETNFICKMRAVDHEMLTGDAFCPERGLRTPATTDADVSGRFDLSAPSNVRVKPRGAFSRAFSA